MKRFLIAFALAAVGCGSSSPALQCATDNCTSPSTKTYSVCVNADGSSTYNYGGSSCNCSSGNTAECTACATNVANYCKS